MESSFKKDAFAIAVGIFLGTMFFRSLEYSLWMGALIGFIAGYLARIITEPNRVVWAAKTAWRKTIEWRPATDWKERLIAGLYGTCMAGGILSVLISLPFALAAYNPPSEPDFLTQIVIQFYKNSFLVGYIGVTVAAHFLALLIFVPFTYMTYNTAMDATAKNTARYCNFFALHYYAVKLPIVGLWKLIVSIPMVFTTSWRFAKIFLFLVHSSNAMACGVYACIGVGIVAILVPANPVLLAVSMIVGGIAGAGMRRVVLYLLQPQTI